MTTETVAMPRSGTLDDGQRALISVPLEPTTHHHAPGSDQGSIWDHGADLVLARGLCPLTEAWPSPPTSHAGAQV